MGEWHERLFLLAIQRIFIRHPRVALCLLGAFGSARAIFSAPHADLRPHFGNFSDLWRRFRGFGEWTQLEESLEIIKKIGVRIVAFSDEAYPPLLREIGDGPPVLVVRGECPGALKRPCVAVVGSRKASRHGMGVTAEISEGLAQEGFTVVSGMAYGIDAAAHRGALSGGGPTVAVMGCGPDIIYPQSHRDLAGRIERGGLIISEFPVGEGPWKQNFPQRNRIISGLSIATVVVEAEARSGSLITVRFALEQGREVMAVPGAAGTSIARGTNGLIKDGAMLVESAAEISSALQPLVRTMVFSESSGHLKNDAGNDSAIFSALSARYAKCFDELVALTGLSVQELAGELSPLAIAGLVEELPGRRWRKRNNDG